MVAPEREVPGNTASTLYAVSYNQDEKIDLFVVIPAQVVKVNNVSSSSVVLGGGIGTVDSDDYVAYDGLKKGDYVLYIKDNQGTAYKDSLSKVDVVNATVEGVKGGNEYRINGSYYKAGSGVTDTPKAGDKIEAALYGNRFYSMDINAVTSVEDMLVVYAAGARTGGVATGVEAKVIFADGTKQTININKMVSTADSSKEYDIQTIMVADAANGHMDDAYSDATYWQTHGAYLAVGALYTYEKDGNDYNLTPVAGTNDAGFDDANTISSTAYVKNNDRSTLDGARIDDAATIFVVEKLTGIKNSDADAKVITGKSLSGWSNWGDVAQTVTNTKNGVKTVMAGVVVDTADGFGSNDGNYGVVNSDVLNVYGADGKRYNQFKLWNGSADEDVYTKDTVTKGEVISYDDDDKVGDIRVIKKNTIATTQTALLDYDGKYVTVTKNGFDSNTTADYKVTSDISVLFIEENKATNGTVEDLSNYKATEASDDTGFFVPNAKYVLNGNKDEIEMIIIDVRGYLDENDGKAYTVKGSPSYIALSGNTITLQQAATAANILSDLNNALAVKVTKASTDCNVTAGEVIITALDGTETAYKVVGAYALSK